MIFPHLQEERRWDLRQRKVFIHPLRFRMTLASVIPLLNTDDWFTAVDLKDACVRIDIDPAHRRSLQFFVGLVLTNAENPPSVSLWHPGYS